MNNQLFNNRDCCKHNCCCNNYIPIPGPKGEDGQSSTINIGSTTTGNPGSNAIVTNSGTTSNAVLNFTIPRGKDGNNATIQIGEVSTIEEGSLPTITNVGTPTNAILNFGIPASTTKKTISGNFISRDSQTYNTDNSIIELPTILNSDEITITNSIITIPKTGKYIINYGVNTPSINNIIGLYINGINNPTTNLQTPASSTVILQLNENDTLTLGTTNASNTPLTLQDNTINAYITIFSLN